MNPLLRSNTISSSFPCAPCFLTLLSTESALNSERSQSTFLSAKYEERLSCLQITDYFFPCIFQRPLKQFMSKLQNRVAGVRLQKHKIIAFSISAILSCLIAFGNILFLTLMSILLSLSQEKISFLSKHPYVNFSACCLHRYDISFSGSATHIQEIKIHCHISLRELLKGSSILLVEPMVRRDSFA